MSKRTDAKTTMMLHSEAKVEFYRKYLELYLSILCMSQHIDQINIIDVFSGTGIYDNGKKGSPIAAFETIAGLSIENSDNTKIRLLINDIDSTKVDEVQKYIDAHNQGRCEVEYNNDSAAAMFERVKTVVSNQKNSTRSLVFIDPYGYKDINKETLLTLLQNGRTEIILFLPISHMQRFTSKALESDQKAYLPLRNFVDSFFEEDHEIRRGTISQFSYINYLKDALRFNKYFTTSYYIERDSSNYFALFFISSHILGFQKILEVKWKLDEREGRGFKQPESQPRFAVFDDQEKELIRNDNFECLENILNRSLSEPKTNQHIYEIVIHNEFLPKHAQEVFKYWKANRPEFDATLYATGEPVRGNDFCLGWEWYNPQKNKLPKTIFAIRDK